MAKEATVARESSVTPVNAVRSNADIIKQRNRLQSELLNAYNRNDATSRTQRRYAQVNNAAVNLLRRNGVPLSKTDGYIVTDVKSRRNVSVKRYPGLNVSR